MIWRMTQDVGGDFQTAVRTVDAIDDCVELVSQPHPDGHTRFKFHTPWGDLTEVVAGGGSAETVYRVKFAISERSEYEIIRQIVADRGYQVRYERFEQKLNELNGEGATAVSGPDQPLVALFRVREPQALIFDLIDDPARMAALLDLLHQRALEGYQLVAKGPGRTVETGMAFITTQLISPRIFEQFVLPYLTQYADVLHQHGKILICHMCGHIIHFLPMLQEAGVDGIDSLSPPPIGDTDLETYWEVLGDHAILQAGLDVNILHHGSLAEVRAHVQDVLKRSHGRHLILRSADEVPYGTPIENLTAVADEIQSYDH
jgi:hypothetical protein